MNYRLSKFIVFAAGAAVGSVVTYRLVKAKYEQILDEIFSKNEEDEDEDECTKDIEIDLDTESERSAIDEMKAAYSDIAKQYGHTEEKQYENEEEQTMDMSKPYVISPDEFDTEGYDTQSLNYYADGVLTNQYDEPIEYPEAILGDIKPEAHFGEFEDDSIYIRNDAEKTDYEILRDSTKYNDNYQQES